MAIVSISAPIVVPDGYTEDDLDTWSFACATDNHRECKGNRINPDLGCDPSETILPCGCGICAHAPKARRGRPRKGQPAE
ncbi:hypothetical protein ACFOY2_46215 [Nonomuraea purpurea]|uniref:Uncharacterized protein n=1 Tax=Nonomuraea purpurea TaxID=1849276 RepID=A0ABV8GP07_9ACTN